MCGLLGPLCSTSAEDEKSWHVAMMAVGSISKNGKSSSEAAICFDGGGVTTCKYQLCIVDTVHCFYCVKSSIKTVNERCPEWMTCVR